MTQILKYYTRWNTQYRPQGGEGVYFVENQGVFFEIHKSYLMGKAIWPWCHISHNSVPPPVVTIVGSTC